MAKFIIEASFTWSGNNPHGGHVMHTLQWAGGLRALGHDVLFYDDLPATDSRLDDGHADEVAQWFDDVMRRWWEPGRSACIATDGRSIAGLNAEEVYEFGRDADALIILGVGFDPPPWVASVRPRVFIDQDPGFTQFWCQEDGVRETVGEQDLYFTVGANIGRGAKAPTAGVDWRPIWPPVVLPWWDNDGRRERDRFTTAMRLWGGGYREVDGKLWGPKAEQIKNFIRLPELAGETLEIAVDFTSDSQGLLADLRAAGWRIEDAKELLTSPETFRDYVLASAGEFSCVKGVYVATESGWFSDRSTCYLAAGRPVVVEDTGIRDHIPTGLGLFAVSDVEEAAAAVREIRSDYKRHAAGARQLAEQYFAPERALRPLLEALDIDPGAGATETD